MKVDANVSSSKPKRSLTKPDTKIQLDDNRRLGQFFLEMEKGAGPGRGNKKILSDLNSFKTERIKELKFSISMAHGCEKRSPKFKGSFCKS